MTYQPTDEQKRILESDDSAFVDAGPGTGKTSTALALAKEKTKTLLTGQKILFISFSNSAVTRISSASEQTLTKEESKRTVFFTYHALAWDIVRTYSRYIGLPHKVKVLDSMELPFLKMEMPQNPGENEQLYLRRLAKNTGKVAFDIMVSLAIKLLDTSPRIKEIETYRFPIIIADEFQDTSDEQWEFLKKFEQSRVIAMSDTNQVIYSDSHQKALQRRASFLSWKSINLTPFSRQNHRCSHTEILTFANCLLQGTKFQGIKTTAPLMVGQVYKNALRSNISQIWLQLKKYPNFNSSTVAIITPSAESAKRIAQELRNPPKDSKVQYPVYTRTVTREDQKDSYHAALLSMIELTKHKNSQSLLQAIRAMCVLKSKWSPRTNLDTSLAQKITTELNKPIRSNSKRPLFTFYQTADIADLKHFEEQFIASMALSSIFANVATAIINSDEVRISAEARTSMQMEFPFKHFRENRSPKGLYGTDFGKNPFETLSMWQAKGREFDYVIMWVDPHLESNQTSLDTLKRLYYVTATRAKRLLIVLHAQNRPGRVLFPVI